MLRSDAILTSLAIALVSVGARAQSGSGSVPQYAAPQGSGSAAAGSGSAAASGSAMRGGEVALDGYCPVCLLDMKEWVAGSSQHQVAYDGLTYRFPDAPKAAVFRANPVKYVPALGGDDVVEYARTGRRTAGKTALGAKYLDRHYFFASDANKQAFTANPVAYANADLALGGACVVCQVDMRQSRPGSPQFVSLHNGMRYRFAGPQQQQAFAAQPDRYLVATPAGSGSGLRAGSGSPGSGSAGSGSGGF